MTLKITRPQDCREPNGYKVTATIDGLKDMRAVRKALTDNLGAAGSAQIIRVYGDDGHTLYAGDPLGLTRNARRRVITAHGVKRGQIVSWGEHTNEFGVVTAIRDDGFYARFQSLYPSAPGGRKPVYMSKFFRFSDLGRTVKIASE